ncbi:MAG: hypothetical protein N3B21_12430 [Clostridia bacterium]|nr:hypothetical protein [Clostridia bacterium]
MESMDNYLKDLITNCRDFILFSGDKPCYLDRWLIKSELADDNKLPGVDPYISKTERILSVDEINSLPKEEAERNWRYFDGSGTENSNTPEGKIFTGRVDRYIYCLSNIFCKKQQDNLLFISTFMPIRIWVNGQMVFTSSFYYHGKPSTVVVRFNEGENSLLVEKISLSKSRLIPMDIRYFTIAIKPVNYLLDSRLEHEEFFDEKLLDYMDSTYNILPERAVYLPEQEIGLVVLPNYFKGSTREKIKIRVFNAKGKEVQNIYASTSSRIVLDIPEEEKGALNIKVEGVESGRCSDAFIFRGNFVEHRNSLINRARERDACSEKIIESIKGTTDILEVETGFINGTTEITNRMLYGYILENLFEFEKYLYISESSLNSKKSLIDIFKRRFIGFRKSEIDGDAIAYNIHLPDNYDPNTKYPLVVYIMYGYGSSKYPANPGFILNRQFGDVIVAGICGRGELVGEYIDETNSIKIITDIIESLNVDRDRVYLIGTCAGAVRGMTLATKMPGAFTALATVAGGVMMHIIDYDYLKNLDNTPVYQLLNIEDHVWNISTTLKVAKQISKGKTWSYYNFSHEEFDETFNTNKLLKALLKEKKNKFPKQVQYATFEPVYCKAHWLKIDCMDMIGLKAIINAEVKDTDLIAVNTQNIRKFSMLLDKEAMGLSDSIAVEINGHKWNVNIHKYSKVSVSVYGGEGAVEVIELTEDALNTLYYDWHIDESRMGIKQIYASACTVVMHDASDQDKKILTDKLLAILRQPLRERVRNYRYSASYESKLKPELLSKGNLVYAIDARNISELQQDILNKVGLKVEANTLNYDGKEFCGEYFALIKRSNPFNNQCNALIIAYNNDALLEELSNLFNYFGMNPMLFNDEIVYNNGEYKWLFKN